MNPEDPIATPEAAGRYLETLINLEKRPELTHARMSLAPIRSLLDRLGKPEQGMSILHVAGSKGKGSTCLFAESALSAAGKRVGVFTSPHLHSWTERFRVAGREVDGDALVRAILRLRPHVEWLRENDAANAPTFFDATTAAALLIFAEADLDHVILEVGLGGRLDSTNVVLPQVCCITSLELEHTDKLGDTIEQIASEKAGILKPGVPCFVGQLAPEALAVVRARALDIRAPLFELGLDFAPVEASELRVLGRHQLGNAAIAIAAVEALLGPEGAPLVPAARKGLTSAKLPGRLEVLSEAPLVIVDGAHTRASAKALAEVLGARQVGRSRLLLSISSDKAFDAILDALLPCFDEVWVTRAELHRSTPCDELAASIRARHDAPTVREMPDPVEAAREALRGMQPSERLVAAGSIYLAAIAREHWRSGG